MRVSTAFNRLLQVPGASVTVVSFEREGVVVSLRRHARRLVCPCCGCLGRAGYDRRGQRYLTLVADHADGAVVWAGTGRGAATPECFFDQLGAAETEKLRAVS